MSTRILSRADFWTIVKSAMDKATEQGNHILAEALQETFENSENDPQLKNVLEGILSRRRPSAEAVSAFQTAIKQAKKSVLSSHIQAIRNELAAKTWFGYDLDDTLHEFCIASGHATDLVLQSISNKYCVDISALRITYQSILATKTADAFTDGRTSTDYQKERFAVLLNAYAIHTDDPYLDILASAYKDTLSLALTLKPGALKLLKMLKQLHKHVIIITEGPKDAQLWTIDLLGLAPYVDVVVTTNEMGKSKTSGLFGAVLEKYKIGVKEMIYVGDNKLRDVVPAEEAGIMAILYDETRGSRLEFNGGLASKSRVDSLNTLCRLIDPEIASIENGLTYWGSH